MRRATLILLITAITAAAQPKPAITKITGETHKLVLFADGTVGGWGDSRDGQLGPRAPIPNSSGHATAYVPIAIPGKVIDVAAGARTSYFLLETGTVLAMGWGLNGELGCTGCPSPVETPVPVAGLSDIVQISASGPVALAVHRDGAVSAWGTRGSPMRGVDPQTAPAAPINRVPGVAGVVQISAGNGHVLARTAQGRVLAWGQLAVGRIYADDRVELPHEVAGLTDVVSVVATGVAAALKKDGTVWVWGHNGQAQFGNGHRTQDEQSRVPVQVPRLANITALTGAVIGRHFLALQKSGTILAWGNSDWGQGGAGITGREQATPLPVKLTAVKSVFAAGNNSFAIRDDGSLWIWGIGSSFPRVWPMQKNSAQPLRLEIPDGIRVP